MQGFGGVGKSTIASYFYKSSNFKDKFWANVNGQTDFIYFAERAIIELKGQMPEIPKNTNLTKDTTGSLLINSLLACLNQKPCLLVIDNLESLINNERELQDKGYHDFFQKWLKGGTCSTLLITTQDIPKSLQNINNWYFLKGMKLSEGVAFARKLGISGTQAEIENFVQFIDGHPLTLELVASYLRNECYELKEIEEQFKLAYEKAKGEHRKQEVYLEWIIQQHLARLSKQFKNFLINLSVYRLSFNAEAASYMWLEPKEEKTISIALKDLWHRSLLLKTRNKKYQFQPLIQKYISQQKNYLFQAHQKAANYYETHYKDINSWNKLEDISEHLESFYHLYEIQIINPNEFFRDFYVFLYLYFDRLYMFIDSQGYSSVVIKLCKNLISLNSPKYRQIQAASLIALGQAFISTGESDKAIHFLKKGIVFHLELTNTKSASEANLPLGNAYCEKGNYQKAIECYRECLKKTTSIDMQAKCFDGIGTAYSESGRDREAVDYYMQALTNNVITDEILIATIEGNLGSTYIKMNNYVEAKKHIETQLDISRNINNKVQERTALMNLGTVSHYLEQTLEGIKYIQDSIKLAKEMKNLSAEAGSRNSLANIFIDLKQFDDSLIHAKRALEISNNLPPKGISSLNVGVSYLLQGKYQPAEEFLYQSLNIGEEILDISLQADSLFNLSNLFRHQNKILEAKIAIENSRKLYERMKLIKRVEDCDRLIYQLDYVDKDTSITNIIRKLFGVIDLTD